MNKNHIFKLLKNEKAFTLIELLVVVAIIGILSSVVLASLNSAREKSKIASIKSTLKQLYNQASLNQLENGSFIGSNDASLNCTGINNNLQKIVQPLIDQGIYVKCFSYYGTATGFSYYVGDDYRRFAATALIYDAGELKAWSVDENGVVKWDTQGVNSSGVTTTPDTNVSMNWPTPRNACALSGGRLPSIEQLKTLSYAWHQGSGNTSYTPVGFQSFMGSFYWSSNPTMYPSYIYLIHIYNGNMDYAGGSNYYLRCVR